MNEYKIEMLTEQATIDWREFEEWVATQAGE